MTIDSVSSNLATPVQQGQENRVNQADTQNRQLQQERQVREDNQPQNQPREVNTERQEDRNSDFALNQNRSRESLNTGESSEPTQSQASQSSEQSQEQLAARTREQIEREFSNVQNPNQGQSRLSIEV